MDGTRINDTGEVCLDLSKKEAQALYAAITFTLHKFTDLGCQETRAHLLHVRKALSQLGVDLDG
jgi:hypothetical protein